MSKRNYWKASLEEVLGDLYTEDLFESIYSIREFETEYCGDYNIPNPLSQENEELKKKLKKEVEQEVCPQCKGQKRVMSFCPSNVGVSDCWTCKGEGKV